ncbi:MAG: metallophosphoesterase [Akkermansiaceae bacterium]|nr:metallophosphoesterase [Akkermansiaceae bacterium]
MKRRDFLKVTLPLVIAGRAGSAPSDTAELSFGVTADPQYADVNPAGSRFYRNSLEKLEHAVADLNTKPLEFTVTLGDLIDRDFKSFSSVMPIYAKLKAPHFPICGNHDFSVADEDKRKVLDAMGLEKAYYSQVIKGWRFVFLDGTEIGTWRYPTADPRTAEARAMKEELAKKYDREMAPWNAAIGAKQMEWLEKELTAAKTAGQSVILFNHYPVMPAGDGHNLWNAEELVALIEKYDNVAAYMNGHKHSGNYTKSGNCHYVNLKGMVETEAETAYATVKCFPDRIEIEGMGLEPARNLDT